MITSGENNNILVKGVCRHLVCCCFQLSFCIENVNSAEVVGRCSGIWLLYFGLNFSVATFDFPSLELGENNNHFKFNTLWIIRVYTYTRILILLQQLWRSRAAFAAAAVQSKALSCWLLMVFHEIRTSCMMPNE